MGTLTPEVGVDLFIHDAPDVPPTAMDPISLENGKMYSIGIGQRYFERERDLSKCRSEWPDEMGIHSRVSLFTYNQDMCDNLWCQKDYLDNCGCISDYTGYLIREDAQICNLRDPETLQCMKNRHLPCSTSSMFFCQQACIELDYKLSISQSTWPSSQSTLLLVNELNRLNMSELLKSFLYNTLTQPDIGVETIRKSFAENFLKVRLYLNDLRIERSTEVKSNTINSSLSSFGGSLGLFLGWSVLSVIELGVLLIRLIGILANWISRKCTDTCHKETH
ncbi:amiloride-sensitive sodium channel subunit beta-like [Symsagittifera roscoffensis]|uniref:amiloride-sensitive sodium channel subunit beta-like n=1 Tax=Symsagittifera roscoffensis TaxID=84072 RepID=UPI00307BD0C4